jgi:hypothetical protein
VPDTLTFAAQEYLEALAEELAISDTRYEQAQESYESLGRWLNRDGSKVSAFDPAVYVQGSFGLGTVIKPLTAEEEYDVDSVCELKKLAKSNSTQSQLKQLVGVEIEEYRRSKNMMKPLKEGRRCWTLNYADGAQFHMDVVPALPNGMSTRQLLDRHHLDSKWAGTAIAITDNEAWNYNVPTDDWPRSNPKGYVEWFKSRMAAAFARKRREIADAMRASVEAIPDYRVRTPLQASIMILKRHRDIMFVNDDTNCCPISIIITTLAAHSYQGEEKIADSLLSILSRMDQFIQWDGAKYVIPNPTDPLENFADKWEQYPERARVFFRWLDQARQDFRTAAQLTQRTQLSDALSTRIGPELAKRAEARLGRQSAPSPSLLRPATVAAAAAATPSFGQAPRIPTKPQGFA